MNFVVKQFLALTIEGKNYYHLKMKRGSPSQCVKCYSVMGQQLL